MSWALYLMVILIIQRRKLQEQGAYVTTPPPTQAMQWVEGSLGLHTDRQLQTEFFTPAPLGSSIGG